ncbi:MAG: hypothetical protein FWB80_05280 [Defluviitaleaceae bacterium]|nr:hypothetical protein [Defluviitaleaceae bacterium]
MTKSIRQINICTMAVILVLSLVVFPLLCIWFWDMWSVHPPMEFYSWMSGIILLFLWIITLVITVKIKSRLLCYVYIIYWAALTAFYGSFILSGRISLDNFQRINAVGSPNFVLSSQGAILTLPEQIFEFFLWPFFFVWRTTFTNPFQFLIFLLCMLLAGVFVKTIWLKKTAIATNSTLPMERY